MRSTNTSEPQGKSDAERDVLGRRGAMAILAQARTNELAEGLRGLRGHEDHRELRPVETGLVMVRGRIGGDGAPFNLGEATVTRSAVQIASGEIGFAYVLGRDGDKARLAALCDALWQSETHQAYVEQNVLAPVRTRLETERIKVAAETAATRVDFFTLVRGED